MQRLTIIVSLLLVATFSFTPTAQTALATQTETPQAKSVILFIGDGMGLNQFHLAEIYVRQVLDTELTLSSIKQRAITTTYALDYQITDSAAAGSAINTGYKVTNETINILFDGRYAYTLGQAAHAEDKAVGIVTTTSLTDATPSSLYGHVESREEHSYLAEELFMFAPEVALGGGWQYFIPRNQTDSKRVNNWDLIADMTQELDYTYVTTAEELAALDSSAPPDQLLGLFAPTYLPYEMDRKNQAQNIPSLAEMTAQALRVLDQNPAGFYLMVEGGHIDRAGHNWDTKALVDEVLAFDAALVVALEYQAAHPDVLIVVTGDHEVGGLVVGGDVSSTIDATILEPITCSLPTVVDQIKADPDATESVIADCGFELSNAEKEQLHTHPPLSEVDKIGAVDGYRKLPWVQYVLSVALSADVNVHWANRGHSAQPVITYAIGPGAEQFQGSIDNTDIARNIAQILGLTLKEPYWFP